MLRILLVAITIVVGLAEVSAQGRAPLVLLVNIAEYFDDVYVEDPVEGTDYVFFMGEPIRLDVSVLNRDDPEHTVVSRSSPASEALWVAAATREGISTRVEVAIDAGAERKEGAFRIATDWGNVRLNPRASVHWRVELSRNLPPGSYVVDFGTDATDETGRPVGPFASRFRFEVRQTTSDSALEITRRRGMRALREGDYEGAELEATSLVRLHPDSLEGYYLLGRIAEAQGRGPAALAAFKRALAIAQSGADKRDSRRSNPSQNVELIALLRSRLGQ